MRLGCPKVFWRVELTVCTYCGTLDEHQSGAVVDEVTAPDRKSCRMIVGGTVVHECEEILPQRT